MFQKTYLREIVIGYKLRVPLAEHVFLPGLLELFNLESCLAEPLREVVRLLAARSSSHLGNQGLVVEDDSCVSAEHHVH